MTHPTDRTSATSPHASPGASEVDQAVVAWVVASCERQGVAVKVTDAAVVARIGVLLGASDAGDPAESARRRSEGGDGIAAA
ncbi:MAG: hypothetical protein H6518_10180 [Microthrixaceae bacterium]|nr:hypothetical protein [Microthrixaceae bacterium]